MKEMMNAAGARPLFDLCEHCGMTEAQTWCYWHDDRHYWVCYDCRYECEREADAE